jgi:hypothetical protein
MKELSDAMRKLRQLSVLIATLFMAAGCGGGSTSTTTTTVYVTISPLSASVNLNDTLQFTETTSGSTNTAVTWEVNGVTGGNSTYGTISSKGLYTPPTTVPNPNTVTVTVVSQENTSDIANASVAIVSGVTVAVSPATADLQLGQTQQFTANVSGNSNTAVTWQAGGVSGGNSTYGTISSSGLYTAPASSSTPMAVSITAVSQVDATKSGSASVTVHGGIKVSLAPNPATVQTLGTIQFAPTISGTTNTGLTWQVNGTNGGSSTVGTISSSGLYTAPGSVPTQTSNGKSQTATVIVTAISQADSTASSSTVVTIKSPNQSAQSTPISLGVSGGNALDSAASGQSPACCGGTLGALVSRGGNFYVLSTNHVLARSDQAATGESIIQPGLIDSSCSTGSTTGVATLSQFANLENPASGKPTVDAALAQILNGQVDTAGTILQLGDSTNNGVPTDEAPHAASASSLVPLSVGQAVAKSGRSTGLTCSTISALNLTVNVEYQKGCGSSSTFTVTFTDLVAIAGSGFSAEGDSGALIVTQSGADPLALLVGSSDSETIANPISDVLNVLADSSTGTLPTIVGTSASHAVAACSLSSFQVASSSQSESVASVSAENMQAATSMRDLQAVELIAKYGLQSVGVGASADQSGEPAILLFVSQGQATRNFPQTIGGFRTRIIQITSKPKAAVLSAAESAVLVQSSATVAKTSSLTSSALEQAVAAKRANIERLMAAKGVQGVGIGASADHPGEPAIVVYLVRGESYDAIPSVIDGVRSQIRETSRFHIGSRHLSGVASCNVLDSGKSRNALAKSQQ